MNVNCDHKISKTKLNRKEGCKIATSNPKKHVFIKKIMLIIALLMFVSFSMLLVYAADQIDVLQYFRTRQKKQVPLALVKTDHFLTSKDVTSELINTSKYNTFNSDGQPKELIARTKTMWNRDASDILNLLHEIKLKDDLSELTKKDGLLEKYQQLGVYIKIALAHKDNKNTNTNYDAYNKLLEKDKEAREQQLDNNGDKLDLELLNTATGVGYKINNGNDYLFNMYVKHNDIPNQLSSDRRRYESKREVNDDNINNYWAEYSKAINDTQIEEKRATLCKWDSSSSKYTINPIKCLIQIQQEVDLNKQVASQFKNPQNKNQNINQNINPADYNIDNNPNNKPKLNITVEYRLVDQNGDAPNLEATDGGSTKLPKMTFKAQRSLGSGTTDLVVTLTDSETLNNRN